MNRDETKKAIEVWSYIVGFWGFYEISTFGRVRRLQKRNGFGPLQNPRAVKPSTRHDGYQIVALYMPRALKQHSCYVHRLVAEAFIERVNERYQVNHIDGNKSNNHVENLEWCTAKQNQQHASKTGLMNPPKGERSATAKLTEPQAKHIKYGYEGLTHNDIAALYGVSRQCVQLIRSGKNWSHI